LSEKGGWSTIVKEVGNWGGGGPKKPCGKGPRRPVKKNGGRAGPRPTEPSTPNQGGGKKTGHRRAVAGNPMPKGSVNATLLKNHR